MPDLFRSQGKSVPFFFPLRALPLLDLIRPGSRLIVHPLESKLTRPFLTSKCPHLISLVLERLGVQRKLKDYEEH
jgi:hypothetical protein